MKKVYLDNCVYNRPFDDLTQERIFIEANAFVLIFAWMAQGDVTTVCSDALTYENEHHPDPEKKARVKTYFSMAKSHVLFRMRFRKGRGRLNRWDWTAWTHCISRLPNMPAWTIL